MNKLNSGSIDNKSGSIIKSSGLYWRFTLDLNGKSFIRLIISRVVFNFLEEKVNHSLGINTSPLLILKS